MSLFNTLRFRKKHEARKRRANGWRLGYFPSPVYLSNPNLRRSRFPDSTKARSRWTQLAGLCPDFCRKLQLRTVAAVGKQRATGSCSRPHLWSWNPSLAAPAVRLLPSTYSVKAAARLGVQPDEAVFVYICCKSLLFSLVLGYAQGLQE